MYTCVGLLIEMKNASCYKTPRRPPKNMTVKELRSVDSIFLQLVHKLIHDRICNILILGHIYCKTMLLMTILRRVILKHLFL